MIDKTTLIMDRILLYQALSSIGFSSIKSAEILRLFLSSSESVSISVFCVLVFSRFFYTFIKRNHDE